MKTGDTVSWKWGSGEAEGTIQSVHTSSKSITTKGKTLKRNGTEDNPALVIKQESDSKVLKLASEVSKK